METCLKKAFALVAVLSWAATLFAADSTPYENVKVCNPAETKCMDVTAGNRGKVDADITSTINLPVTQVTSPWVTSRTWTLLNSTDSVNAVQSGTWTVQQGGTPTTIGNAWPVKLTDGTNTTAVKAASTAPIATDPAAVVVQSPNGNHATAVNQSTEITALQLIDNPVGSASGGAAGTSSYDVGGIYNSTAPTLTNGQQASLQLNSAGSVLVDNSTSPGIPQISRTDVSTTVSTTGTGSTLESSGFESLSGRMNISAISGSGASIQLHIQRSDDATNWETMFDVGKVTTATTASWSSLRTGHRYYRFTWDVLGSTPSITFTVVSTLKTVQTQRIGRRFFYSDLDLTVNGNMSSTFVANDCKNIAVTFNRGADGGNNGTVLMYGSIDQTNWFSLSGNLAANVSTANSFTLIGAAFPYYNIQVSAHTSVGTRVLDIQWACN